MKEKIRSLERKVRELREQEKAARRPVLRILWPDSEGAMSPGALKRSLREYRAKIAQEVKDGPVFIMPRPGTEAEVKP